MACWPRLSNKSMREPITPLRIKAFVGAAVVVFVVAVLLSTGAAFLAVIANYLVPAQVFGFLMASSGAIALLVYLVRRLSSPGLS